MSRGAPPQRVPSAITEGNFIDVTAPTASEDGKALVLNWSTGIFDWVDLATAAELATHAALTATHGVSGAIVGTTDTQTLTNKTLTTPTIADFTNATHDHSNDAGGGTISGGGGGTPGGSSGQWQYNNAGAFAGDSGVTRPTAGTLQLSTALVTPVIAPASDSTTALRATNAAQTSDIWANDTSNLRFVVRGDLFSDRYGGSVTNTILGVGAGKSGATGTKNTGLGNQVFAATTTGGESVAIGTEALKSGTTFLWTVALGVRAARDMTTARRVVAIGTDALMVANADENTAIGYRALFAATSGSNNTAIGSNALGAVTTGAGNFGVGGYTGAQLTTGSNNVFLGYLSGRFGGSNVSGNVQIGYRSGYNESNSNVLHIANTDTKSLILGDFSSNRIAVGGAALETPTATLDVIGNTFRLRTAKTPSSASDTGNTGDYCWDANYFYICVATNTWQRVAHATW